MIGLIIYENVFSRILKYPKIKIITWCKRLQGYNDFYDKQTA